MQLWFGTALLSSGWADGVRVTVEAGTIATVEAGAALRPGDERHAIGLPGLVDLHSHAFQRGMAGLSERPGEGPDSFWTWREVMYRFLERLGPDEFEAIAALAYVEMLETGFTRVAEFHYVHNDPDGHAYAERGELMTRIGAAAADSGIALTLLPVLYAHGNFGGAPPSPGQRRFLSDRDGFARLVEAGAKVVAGLPDAVLGLAPHSLRAATLEEIRAALPLCDGPVHVHVAEQTKEVEDCLAFAGRRPVAYLLDALPVDERWCLIHATHVEPAEVTRIAASGAVVGLCPLTEASLGDGIFPAEAFIRAGGRFGVGSDSNILIDAAGELRMLESSQRLSLRRRNVLAEGGASTGRFLFEAALAGGARAAGASASIAPGLPADLLSLAADDPVLVARRGDALLDSWVFAGGKTLVDCVWRRGERLVSAGRHRDRERVARRYRAALAHVLA